jgi:hypothetical protein
MIWEMTFRPDADAVSVVRRFVEDFTSGGLAMAAHELLENAVKYSLDGQARVRLECDDDGRCLLRLSNRASAEHRAGLARAVAELAAAGDPFMHYQALMRRTMHQEGSGLGLARIAAEADMSLALEDEGDDRVAIVARSN